MAMAACRAPAVRCGGIRPPFKPGRETAEPGDRVESARITEEGIEAIAYDEAGRIRHSACPPMPDPCVLATASGHAVRPETFGVEETDGVGSRSPS